MWYSASLTNHFLPAINLNLFHGIKSLSFSHFVMTIIEPEVYVHGGSSFINLCNSKWKEDALILDTSGLGPADHALAHLLTQDAYFAPRYGSFKRLRNEAVVCGKVSHISNRESHHIAFLSIFRPSKNARILAYDITDALPLPLNLLSSALELDSTSRHLWEIEAFNFFEIELLKPLLRMVYEAWLISFEHLRHLILLIVEYSEGGGPYPRLGYVLHEADAVLKSWEYCRVKFKDLREGS